MTANRIVKSAVVMSTAIRSLIIFQFVISACGFGNANAQNNAVDDFFTHGYFTNSKLPDPAMDAGGNLTNIEISILKGEELSTLRKENPLESIRYSWKRVEIVRAIGIRKLEKWIPELILHVDDIYLPKSGAEPKEVFQPCIWSLAQIGEPSVEPILAAISSSSNSSQRGLLNLALEGIRGKAGAAKLLKERGLKLYEPIDGSPRPDKRGPVVNSAEERNSANTNISSGETPDSTASSKWHVPVAILLAVIAILTGIFATRKKTIRK